MAKNEQKESESQSWFIKIAESLGILGPAKINKEMIENSRKKIKLLRQKHTGQSEAKLADLLIAEKCRKSAYLGGGISAPASIPVIGTFFTILAGVSAEFYWLTRWQCELILEIAELYGYDLDHPDRQQEILFVYGLSLGIGEIQRIFKYPGVKGTKQHVKNLLFGSNAMLTRTIAKNVFTTFTQRTLLKNIPFVSVPINAGINYFYVEKIGKYAKKYYEHEMDNNIKEYEHILSYDPDNPDVNYQLGVLYSRKGKIDLAINSFEKAIALDHNFTEAMLNLAQIYELRDNQGLAMAQYRKILDINPNSALTRYNIGLIYIKQDRLEEARKELESAGKLALRQGNLDLKDKVDVALLKIKS